MRMYFDRMSFDKKIIMIYIIKDNYDRMSFNLLFLLNKNRKKLIK